MANGDTTNTNTGQNWRQLLPLMMASFAGAANPQQAPSIAAQGIAMQRNKMQQERDEQQKKQAADQLKMQQQQLGFQEKRTKIAEAQEERIRKKQEKEDFLHSMSDQFVGKDIDKMNENELFAQLNEKAKLEGIVLSRADVLDWYNRYRESPTGDETYYLDDVTGNVKVRRRYKQGSNIYTKNEDIKGIPFPVLQRADDDPAFAKGMADTLVAQGFKEDHPNVKLMRTLAAEKKYEKGATTTGLSESRLQEDARLKRIEQSYKNKKEELNVRYFGTPKDPAPDQLPTGDQTLEDYQYDMIQLGRVRDHARAKQKYTPPKVPSEVKKYQKDVKGRTVTDRQWGRMTPEQQQMALEIAKAHQQAAGKGGKTGTIPSKRGAAARSFNQAFGTPAPGLLAPTGKLTGPPMDLQMIKRMMEQGGNL